MKMKKKGKKCIQKKLQNNTQTLRRKNTYKFSADNLNNTHYTFSNENNAEKQKETETKRSNVKLTKQKNV